MPIEIHEAVKRLQQDQMPLPPGERADGQKLPRSLPARPACRRRPLDARQNDRDPRRVDVETGEIPPGAGAGDDQCGCAVHQRAFERGDSRDLVGGKARLHRQRMMDQADPVPVQALHLISESQQRQAVNDGEPAIEPIDRRPCRPKRVFVRIREPALKFMHLDAPAERLEPIDDPAVIDIAAGALIERSGNDPVQAIWHQPFSDIS